MARELRTCSMSRRRFCQTGAAVLIAPGIAIAQTSKTVRRIGVLAGGVVNKPFFADEMSKYGWVEGRNLIIERRGGEGDAKRVRDFAAEFVRLDVDVIVAFGAVSSLAARDATSTIPIVSTTGDPVLLGLVSSLSHPGGNITGVTTISPELAGKRLEIVRALLPSATRIAELVDPANEYIRRTRSEYEKTLRALGMQPIFVEVPAPMQLSRAFADISRQRAEALIVRSDPIFVSNREQIISLAAQLGLPTVAEGRRFVEAGALASYAPKETAMWLRTASLVDRILRGAKPAELPIEQLAELELVVNLKTAKALKIAVPQSLLLRADEVIQ